MPSIIEGYNYDIFISYRQKDNKHDGWVTEFVDNLKGELESMFKDEISVYFDINPSDYLLESYDVDASLKEKLKCLIFIPIISRTYCDPKSFAWDNELKAFVNEASGDKFGFKIKLPNGNVANRVLPIRIHDLDIADVKLFESVVGGVLRSIDFVYKETGVNRQLRAKDDDIIKSPNQILYRDQINKVALAIRDIIESMKSPAAPDKAKGKEIQDKEKVERKEILPEEQVLIEKGETKEKLLSDGVKPKQEGKSKRLPVKAKILVPGVFMILVILVAAFLLLNHHSKVKWANEKALPEIEKLFNELNLTGAFNLVQKAAKYIPDDPKLKNWSSRIVKKVTILTDPPGADVYIREYSDINGEWKKIGTTPIDTMKFPWFIFYQVRLEKAGYDNILAVTETSIDTLYRKLPEAGKTPQGMVYVDGYWDEEKNTYEKKNGFYMDRYEVTNKQYKEFVDKGGYRNREHWDNKFIKNHKTLTWEEAIAEFTDRTGLPGPSTWNAGDYPDGQDDYPVSGVSWYEAAAYAKFAGKELPTGDHWDSGVGFYWNSFSEYIGARIYPLSNFNGKNTEPVGKNPGLTAFGVFDMAGNAREWNWNETGIGRIISGAGYDDATYLFSTWNQLPPFDRSPQNGFRCVKYIDKEKIPVSAFRLIDLGAGLSRDYSKDVPVSESIFKVYKNQFLYDSSALNTVVEERFDSSDDWTVEKTTFNAAYGGEKMTAYLYLPKNTPPPYQTLIFFPGSYAETENKFDINNSVVAWFFDFVLKSGRAVIYPVYKGTFERKDGQNPALRSHEYTEWLVKMVKDLGRSIDYLETRKDIDATKLGYYGHSWGGILGGIIPAVETRFKVNILIVGGFYYKSLPEADIINYITRIKIPTLMLNGRYDYRFPPKTNLLPFFNFLGTPEKDKRLVVYETDHYVAKADMIKEVLGWLDKYFGPVNYKPNK
jgi:dipeptidyl aminopeptidase/acylaminoacyl peptidase